MPVTISIAPGVKLLKNVMIPMRDGVHLAADLYMPDGPDSSRGWDKFSVLMEYIPYRKDEVAPSRSSFYLYPARHGYVVARIDIRGSGASEGTNTDEYTLQEQLDGYDAIEWLAAQPWCDGHVNMMGISYGGFSSVQVASHAPPHLTSIIPVDFTDDRYTDDCHYRGGLVRKYYDVGLYGNMMIAFNAMPPYPDWSGGEWAKVWEHHLENNEPYILKWFNHQTDGPYWRHGSVRDIPQNIKCPVFMIGGWRDGYPNPPLRLYNALTVPKKVWIGPWDHNYPENGIPGPRIHHLREVVRWLDHWCKGIDTGIMDEPPVVVYMQRYQEPIVDRLETEGEWRAETAWPAPGLEERSLYLGQDGALTASAGAEGQAEYAYHPTVGVAAGLWSGGFRFGLPGDQRPDEAYSLNYTTPPLDEDLHLLGWAHAILHVASTATVMGFCASLSDVAPDGTSHLVAKGMLNGTRRKSLVTPEPMELGEVYELDIQIDCAGWIFEKGHRLRLSVASADWPNVWPTPQPGRNTVYHGQGRPSRLVLPVVPPQGSAAAPEFEPSPANLQRFSDAVQPPVWQVIQDVLTGRVTSDVHSVMEYRVDDTTVIRRDNQVVSQVDPKDPAHASAKGRSAQYIIRPNHTVYCCSDLMIQATASHFHITIDLDVRVNDAPHFSKRWVESIPRQLL
jgi:putative CocE/NonD family hydrolase